MSNNAEENSKTATLRGLTAAQVEENRNRYGPNVLTPPERDPWWVLYLEKFKDPIIRILVVAAVVALVVGIYDGHFIEGVGIIIAILLSTGLSFFNEYRAAREFDILNQVSDSEEIPVIRDWRHFTVPKRDLVVGDVVLIEQGAEAPADGEVLEAVSLNLNESSLTGESEPVAKAPAVPGEPADKGLAYPRNHVLRGTTVSDGHGVIRLTAVGDHTEIGKTARAAAETTEGMTPLARQLERLAGVISVGAFAAAAVIFVAQTVRGAVNGEIYDLTEQAGRLIGVPLDFGQWFCFFLVAAAAFTVSIPMWAPMLKSGLRTVGREACFPPVLDRLAAKGYQRLAWLSAAIFFGGLALALLTGAIDLTHGYWFPLPAFGAFIRYFMVAVTVIVVAVPEGLPMCVTLALAYSMRKMTATNNLVRKMHACETIGAASVICSDKTGTLTMNEMRVFAAHFPCLDAGVLPAPGDRGADYLAEAVAANSTAHLDRTEERVLPLGNPTEGSLLLWLDGAGRDYQKTRAAFTIRQQLTFSTERKFMATAGVSGVDGAARLYVKGAAEIVLARCVVVRGRDGGVSALDDAAKERILAEALQYQNRGMRVIGFADRDVDKAFLAKPIDPETSGLAWEGFFAIADPIRPDVHAAIDSALGAGVQVKMVTGDNRYTAREIARQAGLWKDGDGDDNIISGPNFEALSDEDAARAAERIKVMSRARPLHKLRLVKLLQGEGEVVAVTGDGTNDAPALNHADVGLAMGKTGTSVAKEAADIILLDDSFNSIVNAVAWGRSLYANIQKFVVFQLTINLAAVGIALLGPFLGITLPLTVVQMLWVNLIMDTFAALALASEPPDWGLMNNRPRSPDAFIITEPMKKFIVGMGGTFLGLFLVVVLFLGKVFPLTPSTVQGRHNLTIFFTAFVFLQFWNLFNARVFGSIRSALSGLRESRGFVAMAAIIVVGQFLLVELGGEMFRVTPLSPSEWVAIIVFTSPVLWVGEIWRLNKRMRRRKDYWVYSS